MSNTCNNFTKAQTLEGDAPSPTSSQASRSPSRLGSHCVIIPYKYMGRYCPKEGKKRRKVTFQFQTPSILLFPSFIFQAYLHFCSALCTTLLANAHKTDKPRAHIAHTREYTRARLPTAMLFFCCHKCHTWGKIR